MKSQKLLILLILFSSVWSQAQVHIPFPMKSCTWKHRMVTTCLGLDGGTSTRTFDTYPAGDTLIGGKLYVSLYNTLYPDVTTGTCSTQFDYTISSYCGAIRQDAGMSKAYFLPAGKNTELLYYDFTLSKGDTLKTYQAEFNWGPPRIVDSVYYQPFSDGICRKVYRFTGPGFSYHIDGTEYHFNEIIEGIGMATGIYQMIENASYSNGALTTARTMTLEINGSPILRSNGPCTRDVGLPEHQQPVLEIWPNPGHAVIHIESSGTSGLRFAVFDMYGRELISSETPLINAESLSPGIYFISCSDRLNHTIILRWIKL